jgi:hypothetical protein
MCYLQVISLKAVNLFFNSARSLFHQKTIRIQTVPNIEKFALIDTQIIDITYEKYSKRQCYQNFVESLLKLNHLKVLEIKSHFYKSLIAKNDLLKAIDNQKFKQLKELKINNKLFSRKCFALNIC